MDGALLDKSLRIVLLLFLFVPFFVFSIFVWVLAPGAIHKSLRISFSCRFILVFRVVCDSSSEKNVDAVSTFKWSEGGS